MNELYQHYKESRNLAWRVLLDLKLTSFPLPLAQILDHYRIKLIRNPELLGSGYAASVAVKGRYYIILRDTEDKNRSRFSTAHELGHILMGHIKEQQSPITEDQEKEANVFASRLLMPSIVCKHERLTEPEQIAKFFGVSMESGRIRAERMRELNERQMFLTHALEREYSDLYLSARQK